MDDLRDIMDGIEKALNNEEFLEKIAEKVASKCPGFEKIDRRSLTVKKWETELAAAGLRLSEGVSIDRVGELYPLTSKEIEQVVSRIKTSKQEGELTAEQIRMFVVEQLGDNELVYRLTDKQKSALLYSKGRGLFDKARGEDPYQCGQPHYCGHPVDCGAPYECGIPYRIFPCFSPYRNCGPEIRCNASFRTDCGNVYEIETGNTG